MYKEIFTTTPISVYTKLKKYLASMFSVAFFAIMLTMLSVTNANAVLAQNAPFKVGPKTYNLSQFKGHKVMLWLFSTWCPSCQVGLKALANNQKQLKKSGLTIIALENYKNGGYQGPTIEEFVSKYGKSVANASNWFFGDATAKLAKRYNSKKYPDIYFLINEKGDIVNVNDAPAATMDKIIEFATNKNLAK